MVYPGCPKGLTIKVNYNYLVNYLGLGSIIWGLGSIIWGLGSIIWGLESIIWELGSIIWGVVACLYPVSLQIFISFLVSVLILYSV